MSCLPEELQYTLCLSDLITRNPVENPDSDLDKSTRLELCAQICSELKEIKKDNCYTLFLDTVLENLSKLNNRTVNLNCIEKHTCTKKRFG